MHVVVAPVQVVVEIIRPNRRGVFLDDGRENDISRLLFQVAVPRGLVAGYRVSGRNSMTRQVCYSFKFICQDWYLKHISSKVIQEKLIAARTEVENRGIRFYI